MSPASVDRVQQVVAAVVAGRRAVEAKERALVASLNEALKRLGYAAAPAPSRPTGARRSGTTRRGGRR